MTKELISPVIHNPEADHKPPPWCDGLFLSSETKMGKLFRCEKCAFVSFETAPLKHPEMPPWFAEFSQAKVSRLLEKDWEGHTIIDSPVRDLEKHPSGCACSECLARVFVETLKETP
jgi:hypothetical protein